MSKMGQWVLEQQIKEDERDIPQIMGDMNDNVTDLFSAWERFLNSEKEEANEK